MRKKKSAEKAVASVLVFCCLIALTVRYGIYAAAIAAAYITVRLMRWRE